MAELEPLIERAISAFNKIHRRVFAGDPAANPRLPVEVAFAATAGDTAVLVVITPWTLNGLIFPPDGGFPDTLTISGTPRRPVYVTDVVGLGPVHSVNLVADVSGLPDAERARSLARSWAEPFRAAVEAAREVWTARPMPPEPVMEPGMETGMEPGIEPATEPVPSRSAPSRSALSHSALSHSAQSRPDTP